MKPYAWVYKPGWGGGRWRTVKYERTTLDEVEWVDTEQFDTHAEALRAALDWVGLW